MQMFLATLLATVAVARTTQPATNVTTTGRRSTGRSTARDDRPLRIRHDDRVRQRATTTISAARAAAVSATVGGLTPRRPTTTGCVVERRRRRTTWRSRRRRIRSRRSSPTSGRGHRADSARRDGHDQHRTAARRPTASSTGPTTRYGSGDRRRRRHRAPAPPRSPTKLTDLRPYTRYHWRTVATNAAGHQARLGHSLPHRAPAERVSLGSRARPSRTAAT